MGRLRGSVGLGTAVALAAATLVAPAGVATAATNTLFHPYETYAPGADGNGVAFGDVTGDGRADVVTTTDSTDPAIGYSLWVYPQQPDGSLGKPVQTPLRTTYGSQVTVALGDLDSDGDLDAAVTTPAGVEIYRQAGGGLTYSWTSLPQGAQGVELADVSGDGLADMVVNTSAGIEVYWQVNGDMMRLPSGSRIGTDRVTELEVADVTGDGLADVVDALNGSIEVRAQNPDHSFAAPVTYASGGLEGWTQVNAIAVGDTNGDGLADVHASVGGNKPNAWIVTRYQQPDGRLGAPVLRTSYDVPESLEVADVTGDFHNDLVVVHGGWNSVGVFDSTPGTATTEALYAVPYASHYDPKGIAVGDVTGDDLPDVALGDYNHGLVLLRGADQGADVTAPDTTITAGPAGTLRSRTATFQFAANEPATFSCSLDAAAWASCRSPFTYDNLAAGTHRFQVRATDAAGNVETTPAGRSFTVDGPDTQITSGPTGTVRSTTATFEFTGGPTPARYECSLDNGTWTTCSSPATYTGLATAKGHTFAVRGVSSDGLVDSSPATRSWTVDRAADVGVTLSASPNPVKRGQVLTWTAVVSNAGPDAAGGVVYTHGLPDGVTFLSVGATTSSSAAASCTGGTTVRCELGAMNAGTRWTVTVRATVSVSKGSLASTAVMTSTSWDPNQANDSASVAAKVGNGK